MSLVPMLRKCSQVMGSTDKTVFRDPTVCNYKTIFRDPTVYKTVFRDPTVYKTIFRDTTVYIIHVPKIIYSHVGNSACFR